MLIELLPVRIQPDPISGRSRGALAGRAMECRATVGLFSGEGRCDRWGGDRRKDHARPRDSYACVVANT